MDKYLILIDDCLNKLLNLSFVGLVVIFVFFKSFIIIEIVFILVSGLLILFILVIILLLINDFIVKDV